MAAPRGLALLLLGLLAGPRAGAVRVSVGSGRARVLRGGSVTLPCAFRTAAAPRRLHIVWTATRHAPRAAPLQILAYEAGAVRESLSPYTGRVAFAGAPTRSADLLLSGARAADAGVYQCSVSNPPEPPAPGAGLVHLTVLVPPSGAECWREGRAEAGGHVRLGCAVREALPPPNFTWHREPPAPQPLEATSEGELRALLTLPNVTAAADGRYRCTATSAAGAASCTLELRVAARAWGLPGLAAGVAVTLTMALLLLALLALALWLWSSRERQQDGEEEQDGSYNDIRLDSFSPGFLGGSKAPPGPSWPFAASTTFAPRSREAEGSSGRSEEEEGRRAPPRCHERPGLRV